MADLSQSNAKRDYVVRISANQQTTVIATLPATDWRPVGGIKIRTTDDLRDSMTPERAAALGRALLEAVESIENEGDRRYPQ